MRMICKPVCACFCALVLSLPATAQLTLDECQRLAEENYPLVGKYELISLSTAYTVSNADKGYFPQLSFTAQAAWQTDVPVLPGALTQTLTQQGDTYRGLKKDQYKVALDLNQTVWDGGAIRAQKEIDSTEGKVAEAETDVDMYAVRRQVNQLFFGLLLIDQKMQVNQATRALLLSNSAKLEAMEANGVAMQSDVDAVRAEYLEAEQQLAELASMKESYRSMLSLFIGKDVSEPLQKPAPALAGPGKNLRPELALFDARSVQADARQKLLRSGVMPRVNLFAQGYYGYPGMDYFHDMFSRDWTFNAQVGIRLNWTISNLYTYRNSKRKIDLTRRQIENSREVFLFNNRLQAIQDESDIGRFRKVMTADDEIVALRTSIREAAEAKLSNGIIDVNNLLREITREKQARLQRSSHEVEWLLALYELKHTTNR
ncbi:MAG: TolC family protein [Parabacteroides sp.]|nr:TolC family protein [Parabacteroides sp.]